MTTKYRNAQRVIHALQTGSPVLEEAPPPPKRRRITADHMNVSLHTLDTDSDETDLEDYLNMHHSDLDMKQVLIGHINRAAELFVLQDGMMHQNATLNGCLRKAQDQNRQLKEALECYNPELRDLASEVGISTASHMSEWSSVHSDAEESEPELVD